MDESLGTTGRAKSIVAGTDWLATWQRKDVISTNNTIINELVIKKRQKRTNYKENL